MDVSRRGCLDEVEEKLHVSTRESSRVISLQVLPSFLMAGLGMVTAGVLLDWTQVSDSTAQPHQSKLQYVSLIIYLFIYFLVSSFIISQSSYKGATQTGAMYTDI